MDKIKITSTRDSIEFNLEPTIKIYTIKKGKKIYEKNNK